MQNRRRYTVTTIRKRKIKTTKTTVSLLLYMVLFIMVGFLINENRELKTTMAEKDQKISELNYVIGDLNQVIDDIDNQLRHVSSINESYVDELNTLRNRSELYDKYEYAIVYNGSRTQLTYEEIEYGEELMVTKGYDPDLMFGSIMVESHANPNAVNYSSGATGYGQFLDSTAKWVWTTMLNNDTYYSDIRKDGKANIQMMAAYYDYLYSVKGNTFDVVKCYSGNSTDEGTARYIAKVNKFISKVGAKLQM